MTELVNKIAELVNKIAELEKENTELKSECRRCTYSDRLCILSDFGKDRNGICDHFKDVFDENVEIKLKLTALEGQTPWKDIKDKSEVIGKLAKAKDLLKKWVELFKPKGGNVPPTPIQVDTEQFLNSEVEK